MSLLAFQTAVAGRYAVERELGRGGMGIVYLARDLRLERVVAIKLLPPERARDAAARERFLREARTAARLSHPNIVPIHAVEEVGEFVFFVMAFVDGETLGARVRRDGPLKAAEAVRILRESAWALAYAHVHGVVHRDVKPDNILVETGGRTLVADFGIARAVDGPGLSGEHELVGTPEYMSPEQATGEPLDGRSDIYSLGVVGYYALSGRLPFTTSTVARLLAQHVGTPPPPLQAPGAPRPLVEAIARCLAKDPAARFQSGEELSSALESAAGARRDLPVPIRAFLTESRQSVRGQVMVPWLAAAILVPAGFSMLVKAVFSGTAPAVFRYGIPALAFGFAMTSLLAPIIWEVRRLRRLLAAGYRREDLVHALAHEVERRREEQEYVAGPGAGGGPTKWERLMTRKAYGSLGLAAVFAGSAFFLPYPAVLIAFGLFGLSCATAVATGLAAHAAGRGRLGTDEEARLKHWDGWSGRLLFRLARLGLKRGAAPPAVDRPTELALGVAAVELFEALPKEMQRRLDGLPAVVRDLEERVRQLRADGDERQLRQALGALDTIRLDLLRLQGGLGTVEGITADLGAARLIGEEVDALIEGHRAAGEATS